jgi:hypothetical protein
MDNHDTTTGANFHHHNSIGDIGSHINHINISSSSTIAATAFESASASASVSAIIPSQCGSMSSLFTRPVIHFSVTSSTAADNIEEAKSKERESEIRGNSGGQSTVGQRVVIDVRDNSSNLYGNESVTSTVSFDQNSTDYSMLRRSKKGRLLGQVHLDIQVLESNDNQLLWHQHCTRPLLFRIV